MLGADTRSTSGSTVADKNCEKIHFIAPNIYCCGAGTAADTENVTGAWAQAAALHAPASACMRGCARTSHPCMKGSTAAACKQLPNCFSWGAVLCVCSHGVIGAGAAQIRHRAESAGRDGHDPAQVPPIQVRGLLGRTLHGQQSG